MITVLEPPTQPLQKHGNLHLQVPRPIVLATTIPSTVILAALAKQVDMFPNQRPRLINLHPPQSRHIPFASQAESQTYMTSTPSAR